MSEQLLEYRRKYSIKRDRDEEAAGPTEPAADKRAVRSESAPAVLPSRAGHGDDDADDDDGDGDGEVIQYSLINLMTVLETVVLHHAHVLSREEHWALQRFRALSPVAQTVWSRLHPRKYRVFRTSSLRVPKVEPADVVAGVRELAGAGFATLLEDGSPLRLAALAGGGERALALLRLLKVAELRTVGASCGIIGAQKLSRQDLLTQLCELVQPASAGAAAEKPTPAAAAAAPNNGQRTIALAAGAKQRDRAAGVERALSRAMFPAQKRAGSAQASLLSLWGRAATAPAPTTAKAAGKANGGGAAGTPDCVVVVLSHAQSELFDRLNFLFFLNQSDFHAMALCNSGYVRYPPYRPNRFPLFGSGADLRAYILATHAVDFAQRQLGLQADDGYGSASMALDVPVPGRSLLRSHELATPDTMRLLLGLACVDLVDGQHVDVGRDPAALCDAIDGAVAGFAPLADELERLRQQSRPHAWAPYLDAMVERDGEPLAPYEPTMAAVAADFVVPHALDARDAMPVSQESVHFLHRFRREYAQLYLLRVGVDWLEKQRDYAGAIVVLRVLLSVADGVRHHVLHKMGALWLRLSLDCAHAGRKDVALRVARLSLHESQRLPLHDTIKLQQRVVLLGARQQQQPETFPALVRLKAVKREYLTGTLLTRQTGRKSLFEGVDGDPVTVEEFVLQHYATRGNWRGMHCENSLWRSIVLLLLWDVVFDDSVPYVFQTPYQSAPLDLYTPFFFPSRRESIEARVAALATAVSAVDELRHTYLVHVGTQCGVSWSEYPCEVLCTVVELLGPATLCALLLYAARDFRAFSKGLPDLCIYRSAPRAQLALVEVKGPRDRLSPEQEAHLIQLCDEVRITAIVCHVAETKAGAIEDDGDDDEGDE